MPLPRIVPIIVLAMSVSDAAAAISVSGVSHEDISSSAQTFTVDDPAGFTTTATLNGDPIAVGSPITVSEPRLYELVVTEAPDGGGIPTAQTILFIIRASSLNLPYRQIF